MGNWRDELKTDPDLYRAYANLLDASVNNVPAFEREVRRQGLWEEYQYWRLQKEARGKQADGEKVAFAPGKWIISGVQSLFKGK